MLLVELTCPGGKGSNMKEEVNRFSANNLAFSLHGSRVKNEAGNKIEINMADAKNYQPGPIPFSSTDETLIQQINSSMQYSVDGSLLQQLLQSTPGANTSFLHQTNSNPQYER